ncbi:MAG: LysR family transcriptional regulator [Rhodocyclales bacterium]|nr:LysR family transcriptional regulator [Rhodocyclales bacterium]
MKITLDALQLLDAIELRGSFAAAAEALHRVPSAVTHAIRRLEQDLGVVLFVREGRRAVPTEAGRALLDEGRHLLRAAGALECRVRRVATGWESELTIAVDATVEPASLFPLIEAFDRENGGTRLRLTNEVLGGTWDALATGRADLAVGAPGQPPPGGGWALRPFGAFEFQFAVTASHPLAAAAEPLTPQDLAPHRIIVLADTSRELLARTAGLADRANTLTVADGASKLAAIVAGLGIGHLPRSLGEREAAAGRVRIKRLSEPMPPVERCLAWRAEHEGKALAWFVDRLAPRP